jgi:transcriptional regulator with XRE-family HTH domain
MPKIIDFKPKKSRHDYVNDIIQQMIDQRKQLGLTQDELDYRVGVADRLIGKWECGTRNPNVFNLCCWAQTLGLKLALVPVAANDNHETNDDNTQKAYYKE